LRDESRRCSTASFAVAFVMESGLDILEGDLRAAALRGACIRFLTSDYMDVTESATLQALIVWGASWRREDYFAGSWFYYSGGFVERRPTPLRECRLEVRRAFFVPYIAYSYSLQRAPRLGLFQE
jgi:hypothetical protein